MSQSFPDLPEVQAGHLHSRIVMAHRELAAGHGGTNRIISDAAAMVEIVAGVIGIECADPERAGSDAVSIFRRIRILRQQAGAGIGRLGTEPIWDEVESHGRYLAAKSGQGYERFLTGPRLVGDSSLVADAILNACSGLLRLVERWLDEDELLSDFSASGMAPWAFQQLDALARIDPRLNLQLRDELPAFGLTRQRPDRNELYRCFDHNRDVLLPPPVALLAFGGTTACQTPQLTCARAAQDALGTSSVLITAFEKDPPAALPQLHESTRIFLAEERAPQLSPEQRFSFLRDYLASMQPRRVVNVESQILWDIYLDFAKPLSRMSQLYAVLPPSQFTDEGAPIGFATTHLPEVLPYLEGVYLGHADEKSALVSMFAYPPALADRLQVLSPELLAELFGGD